MSQRYAACVEYRGTHYHGWQKQSHAISVQGELEAAISKVADHAVYTTAAGRTDTGVHGIGQIIHFDCVNYRPDHAWLRGINTYLPNDIVVRWIQPVSKHFHARYGARSRSYRYIILNRNSPPGYLTGLATWHRAELDLNSMKTAATALQGEHDFSAFKAAGCQNKNPTKHVTHLSISRSGDWVWLDITANGFLHHMVRNIAGTLMRVGIGEQTPEWVEFVLQSKNRAIAGITAPADGLYFWKVLYDAEFALPDPPEVCQFW